ncbi:Major exported protein [Citrobacter koseri]|nr:Major exported protein [Citrobacter koseri]CAH5970185.1 Major exported protein [Citrobacter koseri]
MPTPCYISIKGQTQGLITDRAFTAESVGNIYVQGHEDEMLVTHIGTILVERMLPRVGQNKIVIM